MTVRLSPADAADIAALSGVMERAFDPRFGEAWSRVQLGGAVSTIDTWAERADDIDGDCIGFALVRRVLDEAELLLVAVVPEARCAGLGSRLVEAAANGARLRGCRTLFLEVRDGNPAALLYSRNGFIEVGRRTGYYFGSNGGRFDAVTMRRDL